MSNRKSISLFCLMVCLFSFVCYGQEQGNCKEVKKFNFPIESVSWSPDGTFYITTKGKSLLVWDNVTDSVFIEKNGYDANILSAKLSRDGASVVIVYNDNSFIVEGIRNTDFHIHQKGRGQIPIFDAVFFENYYTLLVPLDGKSIYNYFCLLSTNEGIAKKKFNPGADYVYSLDIDKQSKNLLITLSDGSCVLVDTKSMSVLKDIRGFSEVSITARFNKTGDYFLYAYDENTIKIQSVEGNKEYTITNFDKPVNAADFSPDGKSVAIADKRGYVKVYNIEKGFVEDALKLDAGDFAYSCEFSPDGNVLLVGTRNGKVLKWRPTTLSTGIGQIYKEYGYGYASAGQGLGTGNGSGNGNGGQGGNGKGNDGSGQGLNQQVFVTGDVEGVTKQANIFNTSNAKKIVDIGKHNIYGGVGLGSIKSKYFWGNLKIKTGYHNFQFYPFYWGGELGIDVGFAKPDIPYKYKVNGQAASAPVLLGIAPTGKGGFHHLFDKSDILLFAELGIGANIRLLTLGGYSGPPSASFFINIGGGAQWKMLRAELDIQVDTNFIFSINGTLGCSFRLGSKK